MDFCSQKLSRFKSWMLTAIVIGSLVPIMMSQFGFFNRAFAQSIEFEMAPPIDRTKFPAFSYAEAVQSAAPAVVSIHTTIEVPEQQHPLLRDPFFRHFFFGDPRMDSSRMPTMPKHQQPGLGSGVIVHEQGYILTNHHVIQQAQEITVVLADGREAEAKVIGIDPDTDLAVLKIHLDQLPAIQMGRSDDLLVGDVCLAIGNPFGVGQTVTQGIVSATGRTNLGINTFENFIQTDAAINPGNSGGALIDAQGALIGINTLIITNGSPSNQGIGFAVPIDWAKTVLTQLIEEGHVTRGWLGITVQPLSDDIRNRLSFHDRQGTLIAGVLRQGPAQQAGLMPGDIILSINGEQTVSPHDVLRITSQLAPNQAYPIEIFRDGQIFDFKVTLGVRPTQTE